MRTTSSIRLLGRLRAYGLPIPRGARLVVVHPSQRDRLAGAWSWTALDEKGNELNIGSQHSMRSLLAARELEITREGTNTVIDPKAEER